MKNNKKGLSTIVATLLIILLTLVAVGIIWVVVKNVITGGASQVTIDSKCLAANIAATKVVTNPINVTFTSYNVTLNRAGGQDEIGGVKLAFANSDESSSVVADVPGNIAALSTFTTSVSVDDAKLANATKVSVVVYFLDDSGNPQLCTTANQLSF